MNNHRTQGFHRDSAGALWLTTFLWIHVFYSGLIIGQVNRPAFVGSLGTTTHEMISEDNLVMRRRNTLLIDM